MTPAARKHALAIEHFKAARFEEASKCLRETLWEEETSERWSDWAAAEFAAGRTGEAEAGFRISLEIDPLNSQAASNLVALLISQSRGAEASALAAALESSASPELVATIQDIFQRAGCSPHDGDPADDLVAYLRMFVSNDANERAYFETHLRRYVETLCVLPRGTPSQRVLELGAAFHHLTPALVHRKSYGEVCCNDIWSGEAQQCRRIVSVDGNKQLDVVVDNFDVQVSPWPYPDESFDGVLCCEMLEHLHSDPMGVLAEINRVLKFDGFLLLTTPNLASCHAVDCALKGQSPYVYGKFERDGASTDRHNREYTADEVERLSIAAGFQPQVIRTSYSWWQPAREALRLLAAHGYPIARRGDNVLLLARKRTSVRDRFPDEFYLLMGTQADRREHQGESRKRSADTIPASRDRSEAGGHLNVLVIHELVPQFDRSGSDLRLMDVLRELRVQGHHVTLIARDASNSERYRAAFEEIGIRVIAGDPDGLRHTGINGKTPWALREVLEEGRFHAAILCHWFWSGISIPEQYLSEIRALSPATRIAILTDDRHGERERRSAALSGQFSDFERGEDFETRETELYGACDLLLYITEADHRRFAELLPDLPMEHLPMAVTARPTVGGFQERHGVLFLGNFDNLANRDALDWLLGKVWPLVHAKRPELMLQVAGNGVPEDIEQKYPAVVRSGHVPDLAPLFARCRAFAAPIRFGTGINTKNLQAMNHGVPVVTTSVGAEGLGAVHEEHILIANSPDDYAAALLRVCSDEGLWMRLAANGCDFVRKQFSPERLRFQVSRILSRLSESTPKSMSPGHSPSYRVVENVVPSVLTQNPPRYRLVLRTLAYWQLGKSQLAAGNPAAALANFRHIFTSVRGSLPATVFHDNLLRDMAVAYRLLLDEGSAARCDAERTRLIPIGREALPGSRRRGRDSRPNESTSPNISVVIPTFNRKETLRLCLSALGFQTLPSHQWEVVVVDDGSSDGTEDFCRDFAVPFSLKYVRQENAGAGAARRAGVDAARGEYLLFMNDDTIASSTLLAEHMRVHRCHPHQKWAVLGNFLPSEDWANRALSLWISSSPFLFPQQTLTQGQRCGAAHFVTCNLSVRRDAVLAAGNFDPHFRVAEDTELGARMIRRGYQVYYHSAATATHEHGPFKAADLLSRAGAYGRADWNLFELHPELLGDGSSPFGRLLESDRHRIRMLLAENREAFANALSVLTALDEFDLQPLWQQQSEAKSAVEPVLERLTKLVPLVYWHQLLQTFLAEWDARRNVLPENQPVTAQPAEAS